MTSRTSCLNIRRQKASLLIIALLAASAAVAHTPPASNWQRDLTEDEPDIKARRFFLAIVSSVGNRLTGYFAFRNDFVGPVILHGRTTPDGDFWPDVRIQIAKGDGNEQTISPPPKVLSTQSLIVEPGKTAKLLILLDACRPYVEEFQIGKAILENGEVATFELRDLCPPPPT
jgi:hypothetical protein